MTQFTERGHIFVQVHLSEHSNMVTDAKVETGLNGHSGEAKAAPTSTGFDTLSGLEAADCRNSWENFKMLLSHEQTLPPSQNGMPFDNFADKVTLMVTVEDTGIGIPFHAQNRVFTPFMQADSSTSRNYGGTGIGLSISKCLVELMGGQINFVSRPHIGSTFTFTAVLQRCGRSAGGDAKRALSEALPTCFRGTRVSLVDRRPVRGAVTRYHLQRLGISVECVGTINEVLNAIQGQNGCLKSG